MRPSVDQYAPRRMTDGGDIRPTVADVFRQRWCFDIRTLPRAIRLRQTGARCIGDRHGGAGLHHRQASGVVCSMRFGERSSMFLAMSGYGFPIC